MELGYLQVLSTAAKGNYKKAWKLDGLLTKYGTVFTTGNGDVARTTLAEHSVPVIERTRPVRLPPHWLGPGKEREPTVKNRTCYKEDSLNQIEILGALRWCLSRKKMEILR